MEWNGTYFINRVIGHTSSTCVSNYTIQYSTEYVPYMAAIKITWALYGKD